MQVVTLLDIRLGLVRLTPEQVRIIDERLMPHLTRAAKDELAKIRVEKAAAQLPKASGDR